MNSQSVIATRSLTKIYGAKSAAFVALSEVNLSISKGESVAIVGKSGSGKSTLMHLLALLDHPTSGTIEVMDQDVNSLSSKELDELRNKTFGFVFQQFFLNSSSSVLENVILPLKVAGVGRSERRQRGYAALEAVGLGDKIRSRANDLSGGQKQRVCIARALINNPEIIFADEPTGNLDSQTGSKIEGLLFALNKEQNITLIIVTHDHDLAKKCDRQIYLSDGNIVQGAKR